LSAPSWVDVDVQPSRQRPRWFKEVVMAEAAVPLVAQDARDAPPPPSAQRPLRVELGTLRALAVLPAVCGGLLVAMTLTAGLGTDGALLFLAWMSAGAVLCTVRGERLAVRGMCRCRPPSQRQRQLLMPVATMAMARCGQRPGTVDWYVQPGSGTNACAAGRRSVAVTGGTLEDLVSGRLPADQLLAVLVHELGQHQSRATRYVLTTTWLAAPGRAAFRLVVRVSVALCGGRRPGVLEALLGLVAGCMAAVQLVRQGQWLGLVMLAGLAFTLVGTPLVDGAVSRASEYAADTYASEVGVGPDLARALISMQGQSTSRRTVRGRLLDRHPPVASRVARL